MTPTITATREATTMADKKTSDIPAGLEGFERLFTVDEVADHLRLNRATVRLYLDKGHLRGFRLGPPDPDAKLDRREWRVKQSDLQAFIHSEDAAKAEAARNRRLNDALAELAEAGELNADADPVRRDRLIREAIERTR